MAISKKHRKAQSKRKQRQKGVQKRNESSILGMSDRSLAKQSAGWPLLECLIPVEWQNTEMVHQICVARRSPIGYVAAGVYLVDLGCLGVKNAYATVFSSEAEYRRELVAVLKRGQEMRTADLDLIAKIIEEAITYAQTLGFSPHKDIRQANMVMGTEARPENCDIEVPVGGSDGKPFFFAGPYDNVERVMRTLDRSVGHGHYHFFAPIGAPFLDDDEFDDDDDYEDNEENNWDV